MTRRTRHGVLTPNTIQSVALGIDADYVEVANRSSAGDIWFTVDGTDPTPEANNVEICPAGTALDVRRVQPGNAVIKLLSDAAVEFSIAGVAR
jgi:hypothetical protein